MSSQTGIQETPRDNVATEASAGSLAVVSQELMETIRNAQVALEDSIDGRGGSTALVRSGQLLHQVSGVLVGSRVRGLERAALIDRNIDKH